MASKPSTWLDSNSSTIEKRGFTTMKVHTFKYTWMINNYSLCKKKVGEPLKSPQFSFMAEREMRWYLKLYPSGETSDFEHCVSIFLHLVSTTDTDDRISFKFCILSENGEQTNVRPPRESIFNSKCVGKGYKKFMEKHDLSTREKLLLPNDTLTIICEIRVIDGIASQAGAAFNVPQCQMSSDMGHCFENQKFTDVKLIVGDKQLDAHKVILAARSSVFAAMFEHEMEEREKNEVDISDISYEIVEEMLWYIYSGEVMNLREFAKDLIAAADKYDLERLKVMCEEELYASLRVENAAEVLMIADRHSSAQLEKQALDFIAQNPMDVVETAGYELMLTIPSVMKKVVQAIITKNCKPRSDSGATDAESGISTT